MSYIFKLLTGKIKKSPKEMTFFEKLLLDVRDGLIIAAVFLVIIQPLILSGYYVPTGSMEPTIMPNTRLIGSPLIYGGYIYKTDVKLPGLKKIHQGDIVIFKFPPNPKQYYVKRVIGLPGDRVEIIGKQVYVNGELLEEHYTQHIQDPFFENNQEAKRPNYGPIIVPEDSYFVMGDNRDNSYDSRYWGFVTRKHIFAAPLFIYWSVAKENGKIKIRLNEMFKFLINK